MLLLDDDAPLRTRLGKGVPQHRVPARHGLLAAAADRLDRQVEVGLGEQHGVLPADHEGPRPQGGVGGTRRGVKCLHAHYAWHLAGGDDPVGRWVAAALTSDAAP